VAVPPEKLATNEGDLWNSSKVALSQSVYMATPPCRSAAVPAPDDIGRCVRIRTGRAKLPGVHPLEHGLA
jgi:hypothetical protein